MATKYVKRYSALDRLIHWTIAVTFIILVVTGLGLFEKKLSFLFDLFGGGENAIAIHKYIGLLYFVTALWFSLAHLKDSISFDKDDVAWIKVMGGYLNKKAIVPPMGKYNTGQKIFGIFVLLTTIIFGLTALVIWTPATAAQGLARVSFLLHSLSFVIMITFFVVHVYLGAIGVVGGLEGMIRGEVSEAWAKKYSPKWLSEQKKRGEAG
ncbi:formate dehydrogenase subunit gamma [bacterium]|nr:MAG: formate dehydrogenase subunit gamma [bacterium]